MQPRVSRPSAAERGVSLDSSDRACFMYVEFTFMK